MTQITQEDIAAVIAKIPNLSLFGIGIHQDSRIKWRADRTEELKRQQNRLLNSEVICSKVAEWLKPMARIGTINRRHSSYGLKSLAERDLVEYVSNGEFIVAVICSGFRYKVVRGDKDVYFGISERSIAPLYEPKWGGWV